MLSLGPKLLVVLILAGLVLGPRRLAPLARALGRWYRETLIALNGQDQSPKRPASDLNPGGWWAGRWEAEPPEAYRRFLADFPDQPLFVPAAMGSNDLLSAASEPQEAGPAAPPSASALDPE